MISLVAAMSKNHVIGDHGKLPWGKTMAKDIKRYTDFIAGKTIIMGAKTYYGADHTRDKSDIIVLSRRDLDLPDDVKLVHSVEEVLGLNSADKDLFVTGGGMVFELMIEHADRIYLTVIDEKFEGDAHFPEVDPEKWNIVKEESFKKDADNKYDYTFITYERKR